MSVSSAPPKYPPTTRLAPSPTGALHLGNLRTFLVNHALAVQMGWTTVLRIEDLDTPRTKPGAVDEIFRIFDAFSITWHDGPVTQTSAPAPYINAMETLCRAGRAYPSSLSRTEADRAASAPHHEDAPAVFGAAQRPDITPGPFAERTENHRFATSAETIRFTDAFAGPQHRDPAHTLGDAVIWRRVGAPAYHLAVVVDDIRQRVTQVVRGDDLLDSAALHIQLWNALAPPDLPPPTYTHLPLVVGTDGRRLAKRHGDTRIDTYLNAGVPVEHIVGLVAHSCSTIPRLAPLSAAEFAGALELDTIPQTPFVFTPAHHDWLMDAAR